MKRFIGISLCVCCCGCASIFSDSEYVQKFEASVPDVIMDIEKNGKSYQEGVPVPGEIKPKIGSSTAKASRGGAEARRFDGFSDGIGIYAFVRGLVS